MDKNEFFELASRVLSKESTDAELDKLEKYLYQEKYSKLYSWLKEKWEERKSNTGPVFDREESLKLLHKKLRQLEGRKSQPIRSIISKSRIMQVAAFVAILIGLFFLFKPQYHAKELVLIKHKAKYGERKTVFLSDSTKVILNSGATIQYYSNYNSENRNVALQGEAFFDVKRNEKRPFIVSSGEITTKVLGTAFNILQLEDVVTITVVSGKVKVGKRGANKGILLKKNQQTTYSYRKGSFDKKHQVNAKLFTDWSKDILLLNNICIEQAIKKIEKWYNVTIQCTSNNILKESIRAEYENEPIDYILEDMEFILGINYKYVNDSTIVIYK